MMTKVLILTAMAALPLRPGFAVSSPADPADPAQIERGAAVYASACAACHGNRLEGQPEWQSPNDDGTYPAPPHDGDGHTWHHSDALLFRYIKLGGKEAFKGVAGIKSAMPGFGEQLTDGEIWDVLAFIKSHWPAEAQEYQRQVTAAEN